jgi:23S rRNA pseudouridine2605 synthase
MRTPRSGSRPPGRRGSAPNRPRGDRTGPDAGGGSKDGAKAGARTHRERPRGDRPERTRDAGAGDGARGDRPHRERPRGDRPERTRDAGAGDGARGDRPHRERPRGDRPERAREGTGQSGARPDVKRGVRPGAPSGTRSTFRQGAGTSGKRGGSSRDEPQQAPHIASASRRPRYTPEASGRPTAEMRVAKALARAGLCSRRDAERWIVEGRVRVNGKTIASPALDVGPDDRIEVDGRPLPDAEPIRLWRYHKPRGLVTTHRDTDGRPTVFEKLPPEMPRVVSIGRLDLNTEGLLLLTNDGALARHLELPATGWLRRYRVRAHGRVDQPALDKLKNGITIDGVRYGPVEATVDKTQGANIWLTVALREGKNREVRKILTPLGLDVNRLIRISYGPFQLLDLEPGAVEAVRRRVIADQLGHDVATELGLIDREAQAEARRSRSPRAPSTQAKDADDT